MAELPNLGRHCGAELCNLLDFLPIRCDACSGTFCLSHYTYEGHNCKNAYKKNVQVPTCPLCDKPVPTPKGVSPDVQVNEHIQNNCAQGAKKKIFANRCTVKGCKKKELVPITCPSCHQNFCLGHRHEIDHNCTQVKGSPALSRAAAAAMARNQGGQNCASQARSSVRFCIEFVFCWW
ncbi:AN1-like Zinc finger [Cooperia oncophora]